MMDTTEITTQRLILNRPEKNDLEEFYIQINSSEDFAKNLTSITFPFTPEQTERWLEQCNEGYETGESLRLAIREKNIGKLIGTIGIHVDKKHHKAEVGYWLGKEFWSKGYLTEALRAVIDFGFKELNLNKIFATHYLYNLGSERVMQKSGMVLEGLQKQEYLQNGEFLDVKRYAILKEDFKF